jgi:hypothetical protein
MESFHQAVKHRQGLHPDTYPSVADGATFDMFWDADVCWINLSVVPTVFKAQGQCCAAADVLLSRRMWLQEPSLGQAYFPECPRSRHGVDVSCNDGQVAPVFPIPDEASFMAAVDILCESDHCHALHANNDWFHILDAGSIETFCEDPCRCSSHVSSVKGCGFHDEEDSDRPFCYVNKPSECAAATVSLMHEGEAYPLPVVRGHLPTI